MSAGDRWIDGWVEEIGKQSGEESNKNTPRMVGAGKDIQTERQRETHRQTNTHSKRLRDNGYRKYDKEKQIMGRVP